MRTVQTSNDVEEHFVFERKPWTALVACARFLTNINETSLFFKVTDAIDGKQHERNYQRYVSTQNGARMDAERIKFHEILADWNELRRLPKGSLGHTYVTFMTKEGFEMDALMAAEAKANASTLNIGPSRRRYLESGIALHDIYHVLTGYNRQPMGEACLLAFTAEQFSLSGVGLAARGIGLREQLAQPGAPIFAMLSEARELAREMKWLAEVDWRDEFARPVDEVRSRLNLKRPDLYLRHYESAVSDKPAPETLQDAA